MAACMFGERCEALPRVPPGPAFDRTRRLALFVICERRWRRAQLDR